MDKQYQYLKLQHPHWGTQDSQYEGIILTVHDQATAHVTTQNNNKNTQLLMHSYMEKLQPISSEKM